MAGKTTEKTTEAPSQGTPEKAPDKAGTFAVIATGGKQYKVEKGDVIEVERLSGDSHTFTPVLLVNKGKVRATTKDLEGATVTAKVVGEAKGPKITGFKYKSKSNQRKRWGHRQHLVRIEITDIKVGSAGGTKATEKAEKPEKQPAEPTPAAENQE